MAEVHAVTEALGQMAVQQPHTQQQQHQQQQQQHHQQQQQQQQDPVDPIAEASCPQNGQEEGHDSGVDESTQAKENGGSRSPSKGSRGSPKKRMPRSSDPSPIKPRTPQSAPSAERKVPMNKIEVGKSASPNLKSVKSKIGSMDNATYKPGGGKVKIESKKLDFSKAASRIEAKNQTYTPGGGDKKIESQKLKWNVASKIGSLDNKDHKPGGGDKKIESQKLKFAAQSKIGSKENMKHKPGGGEIKKKSARSEGKSPSPALTSPATQDESLEQGVAAAAAAAAAPTPAAAAPTPAAAAPTPAAAAPAPAALASASSRGITPAH